MYKVTLSMPIYNVAPYVERALLSALNQTFDSIEYIIVDDRGTDNSMDIVRNIITSHPRGKDVQIIEHPYNIGLGAARNTAIDNASGEYLFFMDSDDEITPNCIQILFDKMIETSVNFVIASYKHMTQQGEIIKQTIYEDYMVAPSTFAVAKKYYLEKSPLTIIAWNKLYSIKFLRKKEIKCIPHHLNEDEYFTYQVILKADSCYFLSDKTYLYYQRENSTVDKNRKSWSARIGKQYKEISFERKKNIHVYQNCVFYSQLIRNIYASDMWIAINIYNSKEISHNEKKEHISNVLKYPISINKILHTNNKLFNIPMYILSIIPNIDIKIFISKTIISLYNILKQKH